MSAEVYAAFTPIFPISQYRQPLDWPAYHLFETILTCIPPPESRQTCILLVRESIPARRSRASSTSFADHQTSRYRSRTADVAATSVAVE